MPVTSLARAAAACTAAAAFAIAGVSPALASPDPETSPPADCACGGARVADPPSRLFTLGTDVAAPDQQSPAAPERGPVAQPAPTWPRSPATLTPARRAAIAQDADFHWDDAGIGAGGALAVAIMSVGGAVLIRRRRAPGGPLPA